MLVIGPLVPQEDPAEDLLQNNSLLVLNVAREGSAEPEHPKLSKDEPCSPLYGLLYHSACLDAPRVPQQPAELPPVELDAACSTHGLTPLL